MNKRLILVSLAALSILCSGCGRTIPVQGPRPSPSSDSSVSLECRQYSLAKSYMDSVYKNPQYSSTDPFWISFESGYWGSFWESHQGCPICAENGDGPA